MVKKNTLVLLFCLFILSLKGFTQDWKRYRYDYNWGLGLTAYTGDVNNVVITDNFKNFRFLADAGLGYKLTPNLGLKFKLTTGFFGSNEKYDTTNQYYNREFRTFFLDPSFRFELYLRREPVFNVRGSNPFQNFGIYLHSGISYMFFLPTGTGSGAITWKPGDSILRSIHRSMNIPVGLGFKFKVGTFDYLGIEFEAYIPPKLTVDYTSISSYNELFPSYFIDGHENLIASTSDWADITGFIRVEFIKLIPTAKNGLPILRTVHKKAFREISCPYKVPKEIKRTSRRKQMQIYKGIKR